MVDFLNGRLTGSLTIVPKCVNHLADLEKVPAIRARQQAKQPQI